MILWAHHSEGVFYRALQDFVAQRVWGDRSYLGDGTLLAVVRDNRVRGVIVFHDYRPDAGTVEISGAGEGHWLTKGVLSEMARYVFGQINCQSVIMRADTGNSVVARMAKATGFKRFDLPDVRGKGQAEAFYILSAEDWATGKFKGKDHGKQTSRADAAA